MRIMQKAFPYDVIMVYDDVSYHLLCSWAINIPRIYTQFTLRYGQLSTNCIRILRVYFTAWWRHQMETFSALLTVCAGNSPVTGEFPAQRPVPRSLDVFFDLRLMIRLSKQWWGGWFEALSCPLWRHCNGQRGKHTWQHYIIIKHICTHFCELLYYMFIKWCSITLQIHLL